MRLRALPTSVLLLATLAVPRLAGAAVPSVTSIEPSSGLRGGGVLLTIHGSNFGCAPRAYVGGRFAPTLFADDTTLVVDTPPSSASGSASVRVRNGDGSSNSASYDYEGPWISSVNPSSCPQTGGIPITIVGSDFGVSPKVYFGDAEAPVLSNSNTQVVCTAPRSSGTRSAGHGGGGGGGGMIALIADTGQSSNTADFSYDQGPLVVSVSPVAGRASGGTLITLVGENFGQGALCLVGGQAAQVVSATASRMVVVTPPGAAGEQPLSVEKDGIVSPAVSFTYLAPPEITGISPATVGPDGGAIITINGGNFGPDDPGITRQATAGSSDVGPIRWMAPETMRCTAPPSPDPTSVVAVPLAVTVDGVEDTLHAVLTYDPKLAGASPPAIAAVTSGGPVQGGAVITLTGSNFKPTPSSSPVVYAGTGRTLTPLAASGAALTFLAPDTGYGTSMPVGVEVDGLASPPASLDYDAPTITSVSPSSGDHAGGTLITIFGKFPSDPQVLVGADAVEPLSSSESHIVCNVPLDQPSAGQDVSVTGGGGTTGTLLMTFSGPVLTSITPDQVSVAGGTVITISGSGFPSDARVLLDGHETFKDGDIPDQADRVLPPGYGGGGGGGVLVVIAGNLRSNRLGLSYDAGLDPAISSVSPSEGRSSGGTLITIRGSNFGLSPRVTMEGDTATVVCSTPDSIVCRSYGSGGGGGGAVYLELLEGAATPPNAFVFPDAFTYLDPPQVTSVDPGSGPAVGGTVITIFGDNFGTPGSGVSRSVTVGGSEASQLEVVSGTELRCVLPAASDTGLVDVAVTVDEVATVLPGAFQYQGATTGVGDAGLPARFALAQNRPNPFRSATRIEFAVPRESDYDLTVFDLAGRVVRRFTGHAGAGVLALSWDGRAENGVETAPGMYFYRMRAGAYQKTLRMVRLR